MPGPAFQTALQFRLGVSLTVRRREGGRCACNKVDFSATHSAGCKVNGWAYKHHGEIISFFVRLAKEAGLSAAPRTNLANTYPKFDTMELRPTAKARYIPDVIISNFPNMGTHMVLDVFITHPCGDGTHPSISGCATTCSTLRSSSAKATPAASSSCQPFSRPFGTPTKETLKLIHDLCDLHSHLHLHDAADRCVARHYWVRQASNALQWANAHQLHHLAADCPGAKDGMRQP